MWALCNGFSADPGNPHSWQAVARGRRMYLTGFRRQYVTHSDSWRNILPSNPTLRLFPGILQNPQCPKLLNYHRQNPAHTKGITVSGIKRVSSLMM
jgi:hypothetical protein